MLVQVATHNKKTTSTICAVCLSYSRAMPTLTGTIQNGPEPAAKNKKAVLCSYTLQQDSHDEIAVARLSS